MNFELVVYSVVFWYLYSIFLESEKNVSRRGQVMMFNALESVPNGCQYQALTE